MNQFPTAPFFAQDQGNRTFWVDTSDGKRVRVAAWSKGKRGTIFLFTGRTEYCEKYLHVAARYQCHGYAFLTFDWRGQGLSDRASHNRSLGHVGNFAEFQLDVEAVLHAHTELHLPQPIYLLAHSMGGCIALRALHHRLAVKAVHLAAPMWGIAMPRASQPCARLATRIATQLGLGKTHIPKPKHHRLKSDPDMVNHLKQQVAEHPDLYVGGASVGWLHAALEEFQILNKIDPLPDYPVLISLGERENIVDPAAIHRIHRRWPQSELKILEDARHEMMMERPDIQEAFFAHSLDFFIHHSDA